MATPRIAFDNRFWSPQDLSFNPHVAHAALMETSWTSLAYGIASAGKFLVYAKDEDSIVPLDTLYEDAVSLSLGIFTIAVPHGNKSCTRLICNCKTM